MPSFPGIHAIIIDDDATSISVLEKMLRLLDVNITVISNPQDLAQELAQAPQADIVFLDLEMPVQNGYDVLGFLRESPAFEHTKMIAYTTHTSHMNTARQAGFHGFLGK